MNHPTPEAWMSHLYQENTPESRVEMEAHLASCVHCREQVVAWRQVLGVLDQDPMPMPMPTPMRTSPVASVPGTPRKTSSPVWLPWSIAAGIALTSAVWAGHAVSEARKEFRHELGHLREELTRNLTESLRSTHQQDLAELATATVQAAAAGQRELVTTLTSNFETSLQTARMADRRDFLNTLERLDQRRALELATMREGFQTLAEKTGGAFREADTRLNALASVLPIGNPTTPGEPNP